MRRWLAEAWQGMNVSCLSSLLPYWTTVPRLPWQGGITMELLDHVATSAFHLSTSSLYNSVCLQSAFVSFVSLLWLLSAERSLNPFQMFFNFILALSCFLLSLPLPPSFIKLQQTQGNKNASFFLFLSFEELDHATLPTTYGSFSFKSRVWPGEHLLLSAIMNKQQ